MPPCNPISKIKKTETKKVAIIFPTTNVNMYLNHDELNTCSGLDVKNENLIHMGGYNGHNQLLVIHFLLKSSKKSISIVNTYTKS